MQKFHPVIGRGADFADELLRPRQQLSLSGQGIRLRKGLILWADASDAALLEFPN
jgi:hypothetical protein